ncbi:MAG: hypothetical protein E7016_07645 [Alphaproteobacteria bacterium]|nr:hypothetical protein [Alphaproteobacteria bacterium]
MRKYFLLSAVALLATTTANATTDYAEVTAKATIQVARTLECSSNVLQCGTIVVKQNNKEMTLFCGAPSELADLLPPLPEDIISVSDTNTLDCPNANFGVNGTEISTIDLTSGNNKMEFSVAGETVADKDYIAGRLTIPSQVQPGEYTGSFTVTVTQE